MRDRKKKTNDLLQNQTDRERMAMLISPDSTPEKMAQENEKRINGTRELLAKAYLCGTDMNIQDIAWILGYGSKEDFERAFIIWTGMEPNEFREKHPGRTGRIHAGLSTAW